IRAAAREFKHCRAAKTITDGGNLLGIHKFVFLEHIKTGIHAGAEQRTITFIFSSLRPGFAGVSRSDALAVNIRAESDVTERRKLLRTVLFVISEAEPLMHDQHA